MSHPKRIAACQDALESEGADAVVLFPSVDMGYLSGFTDEPMERHLFLFVTPDRPPVFVAPTMYESQIRDESVVDDVRVWDDGDDPLVLVEEIAETRNLHGGRLLVDDRMWARFSQDLRAVLPDASFGLASDVLASLRIQKDEAELNALREAGEVADRTVMAVRRLGDEVIGFTETELAQEIEAQLAKFGGNGVSFDAIVGSGPNGAKPHHRHGEREIRDGDPVVLDFGTRVGGYPSDQTRTIVFAGEPPEEFDSAHRAVRRAHDAAIDAVEPGVTAETIDAVARGVIEEAGYGEQFVHRTGHGVGLEVHEPPYIVAGNDRELEPGMVFSVEPGIYLEGEFGIRIEDLVVVTENSYERLNDSPRDWGPL
ncbi:M24 family metallopeptidase [Haloarchaeobius iranensis]|uniref:Xaa-Pro aminopeptidase n=1 Tax=Haloarchaeobius iranensis TaxID=996166 RepID=A0A1H0B0J2_9EURY|nr:Xaa-Pro peptidase family protein [Haloarchaeobius iranensis]SDN39148.1 Xaa-Pro aminopeptidase [Haloarchaeobius iranensis]